jgi:ribonucleoside-diphosphate reductase alpha chain
MADNIELSTNSKVLKHGAKVVIETNREWAKRLGINTCARGTTVKPEGTSSLWLGCLGSGVHARYARRYFRRITANSNEPAAQYFRSVNPHAVEVKPNGDWSLVFPVESPSNALTVKEESAMEFLKRVFQAYEYWVLPGTGRPDVSEGLTHNVSCTVTLKPDELKEVQDTVWNNRHRISAMSFSPYLLDKFFPFAPNEEAHDEKRWNELISLWKPVDWTKFKEEEDNTSPVDTSACEGAACAVR